MQYECDQATESRKEAEKLKRKLSSLTRSDHHIEQLCQTPVLALYTHTCWVRGCASIYTVQYLNGVVVSEVSCLL